MLLLASMTLLGAIVSAEPKSNVVTPEGSELPDPSVGHEFKATSAENLVHDLQLLCADGCFSRSRYSRCEASAPVGTRQDSHIEVSSRALGRVRSICIGARPLWTKK